MSEVPLYHADGVASREVVLSGGGYQFHIETLEIYELR